MNRVTVVVFMWFVGALPLVVEAAFLRNLKVGDQGPDVRELQVLLNKDPDTYVALSGPGSPGQETDYFGVRTSDAVARFQRKYKKEILDPAGLVVGTGYVGILTRAQLYNVQQQSKLTTSIGSKNQNEPQTGPVIGTQSTITSIKKVVITDISPARVRSGDMVTITGEGFTPTGNNIDIGSGLLVRTFENIPSVDGKTLVFRYEAPVARTMTLEELRALPADILSQIETPVRAAGATLEDVVRPYKGIKNEDDLAIVLAKNGKSLRDLDDLFHVSVSNSNGSTENPKLLLRAARHIIFEGGLSGFFKNTTKLFSRVSLVPKKAEAQLAGGGLNTTIVMICTCGGGTLNFLTPFGGGGGGLTYFPPGFVPITGSTMPGGFYLGLFTPAAGVCSIYAGLTCITVMGSLPTLYGQSI